MLYATLGCVRESNHFPEESAINATRGTWRKGGRKRRNENERRGVGGKNEEGETGQGKERK